MARYKVILAYDGTAFYGSQRQAEARTIQSDFETALRKLGWDDPSISLAGRTDSGVHASGQVVAFDLSWNHTAEALLRALNALLPDDIAARSICVRRENFHPRFDAISRMYRYKIFCDPARDPLRERYAWRVWPAPDYELLQDAAQELIGVHDFAAFGRATNPEGSTIREVRKAIWQKHDEWLTFEITANAFLYHMVRRMVFVQVTCGQGKLEVGKITQVLGNSENQIVFQGLAPAQGLHLVEVTYPRESEYNE